MTFNTHFEAGAVNPNALNHNLSVRRQPPIRRLLLAAAVLLSTQLPVAGAIGPGTDPGPQRGVRIQGQFDGKSSQNDPRIVPRNTISYGEWTAKFWQWALSIPADRNPIADETGAFCGEEQQGKVWFLPGTFGNSAMRTCIMPAGKIIFMPVFNWIFGSGVFDCEPTVPNVPCNVDDLRNLAAENTGKAEILEVTIDDVPVQDVRDHRAGSPSPFPIV